MHNFKIGDKVRIARAGETAHDGYVGAEGEVIDDHPGRPDKVRVRILSGRHAGANWIWAANWLEPLHDIKAELEEALHEYAVANERGDHRAPAFMLRALEVAVAALGTEIPEVPPLEEPTRLGAAVTVSHGPGHGETYVRTILLRDKGLKAWRSAAAWNGCPLLRWSDLEARGELTPRAEPKDA